MMMIDFILNFSFASFAGECPERCCGAGEGDGDDEERVWGKEGFTRTPHGAQGLPGKRWGQTQEDKDRLQNSTGKSGTDKEEPKTSDSRVVNND